MMIPEQWKVPVSFDSTQVPVDQQQHTKVILYKHQQETAASVLPVLIATTLHLRLDGSCRTAFIPVSKSSSVYYYVVAIKLAV
jgi:hypothetical protein